MDEQLCRQVYNNRTRFGKRLLLSRMHPKYIPHALSGEYAGSDSVQITVRQGEQVSVRRHQGTKSPSILGCRIVVTSGDFRLPAKTQPVIVPETDRQRFPPEFEFLLACCRADVEQGYGPSAAPIPADVDKAAVLELADQHGLIPFLSRSLPPEVPVWPELAELFKITTRRSLWLGDLLCRVLKSFNERGIEALPYKGPVLAQELYGDIGMRQYSDLDILIREADVTRAGSALAEIGLSPHLRLTAAEHKAYLGSGYEFAFDGFGNANLVELQWRILPRFYAVEFETEEFFHRARALDVFGMKAATLGGEDLFLVLCVHAAKHLWARLSWIYEIVRLGVAHHLDWQLVEREATRLGIQRIVAVSFRLGHDLFRMSVPQQFETVVNDAVVTHVAAEIVGRLVVGEQPETESLAYFRQILHLRERALDKLRFVFRLASTPSVGEWEAVRFPQPLFPLYRVVRLVRLARRLGEGRKHRHPETAG